MIKGLMKCWCCGKEMVWGSDFSREDYGLDGEGIISNFSCECGATAEFYHPTEEE